MPLPRLLSHRPARLLRSRLAASGTDYGIVVGLIAVGVIGSVRRCRFLASGEHLIRDLDGTWRAEWQQEKTGAATESGAIQMEICEILDEWILGWRPGRLIHQRYQELVGRNWLSLESEAPYRNLPTELTRAAIGVPSHDLRTLAADYMRRHYPAHAADVIATHLGHRTREAGKSYRAECSGAAAQAVWMSARETIAARSAKKSGKRSRRQGAAGR